MSPERRSELFHRAGEIVYARHMGAASPGFRGTLHAPEALQEALRAYSIATDRCGESRQGVCESHGGAPRRLYRIERHDLLRGETKVSWRCAECLRSLHYAVIA